MTVNGTSYVFGDWYYDAMTTMVPQAALVSTNRTKKLIPALVMRSIFRG